MDLDKIISIVKDRNSNPNLLHDALEIVRYHIDYCALHNINVLSDPLLAKVLVRR